jgi:phytoene synthase
MSRKTSFYYAFLILPAEQRRAIIAVWDFCRAVDDAVDEPMDAAVAGQRAPGASTQVPLTPEEIAGARVAVQFWRDELARVYGGPEATPETPQGRALQPFVASFDLPRRAFEDVIDGVAMDLDTTRYQTFEDLLQYCYRVASAVGMICIRIFGCTDRQAEDYALNLGVALQLTNILRDVSGDLDRGRVYLPLDDLAAHGCSVADLEARQLTPALRQVLAFECARAHEFYRRAVEARPAADRHRLAAAEIMRAVYFEYLRRIEERGYDVLAGKVRLTRPEQALIALRQWLWPA